MSVQATGNYSKSDFNKAYKQYQTAVEAQDLDVGLVAAEKTLEIGTELFGPDDSTTALLTFNHAQIFFLKQTKLSRGLGDFEKSEKLFKDTLAMYETIFGKDSLELIDPLMSLGMLHIKYRHERGNSMRAYKRALILAKEHKDSPALLYADLSLEVGREYAQRSTSLKNARRYLQSAYEQYSASLPPEDVRVIDSAFWYGKYNYLNKRYDQAEKLFLDVVSAYEKAGRPSHKIALTTNAFLVKLYEEIGDRDKATAFCQAIGKAKPWSGEQEQIPVFILEPKWPLQALRSGKGGSVKLLLTIDKNGFVKDPELLEAKGHKALPKAAMETVLKWRFAPKYENGEPVEAKTTYTMEFRFE